MIEQLSTIQAKVRAILQHHKLTEVGDGVVEADLIYAVLGSIQLPQRKPYKHGRDFFQGEGQEVDNARIDGWNECLIEIRKDFITNFQIRLEI